MLNVVYSTGYSSTISGFNIAGIKLIKEYNRVNTVYKSNNNKKKYFDVREIIYIHNK